MTNSKLKKGYFKVMMIGSNLGKNTVMGKGTSEMKAFKSAPKCVTCLEGKITTVFIPCGHMCACESCTKMIKDDPRKFNKYRAECPICT